MPIYTIFNMGQGNNMDTSINHKKPPIRHSCHPHVIPVKTGISFEQMPCQARHDGKT